MQGIPVKIKNVSVYPYLGIGPIGPVVQPIIVNGSGTYTVSTLGRSIFYNLDLSKGDFKGEVVVHERYAVIAETTDGETIITPWLYCTEAGKTPKFGRTTTVGGRD